MIDYEMIADKMIDAMIIKQGAIETIDYLLSLGLNENDLYEIGFDKIDVLLTIDERGEK